MVGLTEEEAKAKLDAAGLKVQVRTKSSYEPRGTVIEQSRRPDNEVERGAYVRITVSDGSLPGESRQVEEMVEVYLNPGERAMIEIKVTDATGQDKSVHNSVIDKSMQFKHIPIVVTPSQDARIQVYKDGQLFEEKVVKYSDVQ